MRPLRDTSSPRIVAVAVVSIALAVIRPFSRLTPAIREYDDTSTPPRTFFVWFRVSTASALMTPLRTLALTVLFSTMRGAFSTRSELAAVSPDWTAPATWIRVPPLTAW